MRAFATTLSLLLTSSILPLSSPLLGQPVPIRAFNVPLVETFDALGPDGLVAMLGWRAGSSEATLTRNLRVGTVPSTDPGAYNVPGSDPSDRSVGFLQGKGRAGVIDVRLRNLTGSPIDAISIGFDAVQWRFASDTRAQSGLELLYSSDGESFVSLGRRYSYHAVPDLDFRPLVSRNQSVRVVARVQGRWILPALLSPGAECILRWRSTNTQIDGVGFAVDNVEIIAHPVLPTSDGDGFATVHNPFLRESPIFDPDVPQPVLLRLKGRPGGPLVSLTIMVPPGWSLGSQESITLQGPAFERATVELEDDHIVISGADLTDMNTGSILIGECLPPPSPPGSPAAFRIFTSISGEPGGEIQESPKAVLLQSISSVRERMSLVANDQTIAVEGTVLCPYSLDDTQGEFYLEDHGSGIRVIFEEQDISFSSHERLLVRGRYVEDRGSPTLLVQEYYRIGTERAMSHRPSSIQDVARQGQRFEGALVILRNLRKVRMPLIEWPPLYGESKRYLLTDPEGGDSLLLTVHPSSGIAELPEPKYPLTLRGIIVRIPVPGTSSGRLAILPRYPDDLNPVLTPMAPELRSPAREAANLTLMPTLEWEPVVDASSYHLQLSTDSSFMRILAEDSLLQETAYRCPELESEAGYYWRVRGRNADGFGAFSEVRRFTTIAHPTVRIVDPPQDEVLPTSSVELRVVRSGFWYDREDEPPVELQESQSGFLKISVDGTAQAFVEKDSLWVVRLGRGQNLVTAELVDRNRRPLRPPVVDSALFVVAKDAWVVRAYTGEKDASEPLPHNSSSLRLTPEVAGGASVRDLALAPTLALTVDGLQVKPSSDGSYAVTALVPGVHRIRSELVDEEGSPLVPRAFDEFAVAIPDSAPYLRIAAPSPGDTVDQSGGQAILVRRNLIPVADLEGSASGRPFWGYVLSVNGVVVDTSESDTLSLGQNSPGPLRVRVDALNSLLEPFEPPVFDEIELAVRSAASEADRLEELKAYVLEQNYPNPFNAETEIRFTIPVAGHVTVRVFNLLGQEVALLLDSDLDVGEHRVRWDGLNDSGKRVSTGIYMVRLQSGPFVGTRRMLLVK